MTMLLCYSRVKFRLRSPDVERNHWCVYNCDGLLDISFTHNSRRVLWDLIWKWFTFAVVSAFTSCLYTCQVSRLRRDCHACGSKTAISRLLTPAFRFLMPGGKVWAFTALTDSFWKKIINYLNKLELMRENNDRAFAKSRILVGKATGDIVILV